MFNQHDQAAAAAAAAATYWPAAIHSHGHGHGQDQQQQQVALPPHDGGHGHHDQEPIGYLFTASGSPAPGGAAATTGIATAAAAEDHILDSPQLQSAASSHLVFPAATTSSSGKAAVGAGDMAAAFPGPYKYELDYNLNSPYCNTGSSSFKSTCGGGGGGTGGLGHMDRGTTTGAITSLQLQALRDFMSYGAGASGGGTLVNGHHSHHHGQQQQHLLLQASSPDDSPVGHSMFLQQVGGGVGEESLLLSSPRGRSSAVNHHLLASLQQESPGHGCKPPPLQQPAADHSTGAGYRALCGHPASGSGPGDMTLFTAAGMHMQVDSRSPHRSQFQRENHIMAERQRREEMNEKFTALRSMIPKATKKDKASIVGDTINYVLELEKTLKHLQSLKAARKAGAAPGSNVSASKKKPFVATARQNHKASPSSLQHENYNEHAAMASCTQQQQQQQQLRSMSQQQQQPGSASQDDLANMSNGTHGGESSSCFGDSATVDAACGAADPDGFLQVENVHCKPPGGAVADPASHDNGAHELAEALAHVEVEKLRDQAVIKIMCTKSPGLVFRIMHALDVCKVDLLQGNVTTVDDNSIYFITVQLIDGLSSSPEDLALALKNASSTCYG